jgi:cytochrome oxidase Cu insertion factor (SCO1/SenC/PrrC family)
MKMNLTKPSILLTAALAFSACNKKEPPHIAGEPLCHTPAVAASPDFSKAAGANSDDNNQETPAYAITLPGGEKISLLGLVDQNGRIIDNEYLAGAFKNKKVMLYFGFPDCDFFCPPSTRAMIESLRHFNDSRILPVLIASRTDLQGRPYTPERMQSWLENFRQQGIHVVGLTGDPVLLEKIYTQMQVIDGRGNHVPYVGLIDTQGHFLGGVAPVTLTKDAMGKPALHAAPRQLIAAIEQKWGKAAPTPQATPQSP